MSIPMILFALAVVTLAGSSLATIILIIITFMVPGSFRVVRSQTRVLKRMEYIVAAQAMGASPISVVVRHLIPNLTSPLLVMAAMISPR